MRAPTVGSRKQRRRSRANRDAIEHRQLGKAHYVRKYLCRLDFVLANQIRTK
jgi:hypothetical protein